MKKACQEENIEDYNRLADIISCSNKFGSKRLSFACHHGSLFIAHRLIERGKDVNASDWMGRTALHLASNSNHSSVAKLLIESGADVNSADRNGCTSLHYAVLH